MLNEGVEIVRESPIGDEHGFSRTTNNSKNLRQIIPQSTGFRIKDRVVDGHACLCEHGSHIMTLTCAAGIDFVLFDLSAEVEPMARRQLERYGIIQT